ncbi:unnamed protein product [Didymodactylos carnosus]|uniref:Ion transport domain-containing protein n=1 Tax=Didymodactylos carnosus TaxID=1234261 RepID=A0A815V4E5_9BILA|nr:unnamed protein product [Didymodactylos carnosus]CAF4383506.1 unnamed protein product [Didymodactylos carnosus]
MLTVFLLSFGVPAYALIHDAQPFTWHLPRKIFNIAYWEIFGDLKVLELIEDNYTLPGYFTYVLLGIYMAFGAILLVNLLIAMFSNTFSSCQTDTDYIWKSQRFKLVFEYLDRPSLPPPLICIPHLYRLFLFTSTRFFKSPTRLKQIYQKHIQRTSLQKVLTDKDVSYLEELEDARGDEVYFQYLKNKQQRQTIYPSTLLGQAIFDMGEEKLYVKKKFSEF